MAPQKQVRSLLPFLFLKYVITQTAVAIDNIWCQLPDDKHTLRIGVLSSLMLVHNVLTKVPLL